MPTSNPRVNVTLSPSTDALVTRLSELRGVSKSQVLRELLEAAGPALQRVVTLLEAAAKAPAEVLGGLSQSLDRAQSQIEALAAVALSTSDGVTADLVGQAERVRGRRRSDGREPARAAASPARRRGTKAAA